MLIMSRIFVVYVEHLNNLVTHTLVFRCLLHTFTFMVLHLVKELEECFLNTAMSFTI